jgi:hypothetical protein
MKRLITLLFLTVSVSAMAQPGFRHHYHGYHPGYNYSWVAPTVIGGVIGYEIARNYPPVIVQQPVVIQQAPMPPATVYYGQSQQCSEWVEVQQSDGTVTRTRTCRQ